MSEDEAINQANTLLKAMRNASERNLNSILFEAVITRSDIKAIEAILTELEKKDKIINAMALQLSGISIWNDQKEEPLILMTEKEVKQYFERKVENGGR